MKNLKYILTCVVMATLLAVSAFATITLDFSVEDATTDTGASCYKVVVTQSDDEGDWRALQTKISFNYNKIVPIDWYDGSVPSYTGEAAEYPFQFASFKSGRTSTAEISRPAVPVWTINGESSDVVIDLYWSYLDTYPITASETFIYEMYFKLADGVTMDDLAYSDFNVYFVQYANGVNNFYGNEDKSKNNIILTNNVVPEAPAPTVITIPVLAGDKVYLQDGTVEIATETTEAYEVPATVGYVAVNTGNEAQATWYIDGTTATQVHTNGVVGSDELALRGPDELWNGEDRSGLRFKMLHNSTTREVGIGINPVENERDIVTEVGFLMTAETTKVLEKIDEDATLTMDMLDTGVVLQGVAYGYDPVVGGNVNKAHNQDDDELWVITGVFYGVPINATNVQVKIVSRPYYKVGNTYIYGEQTETTLYDTAKAIKDDETKWEACTEPMQDYINEILFCVDGTEMITDEVIIDVSGLYE